MTQLHMILRASKAIRGPGKPRIVEPFKPFYCPLDWLKTGAQNALWRQNRLIPVDRYVDEILGMTEAELRAECKRRGVESAEGLLDGLTDRKFPEPGLDFRGLQKALKDLGLSAAGDFETLKARYEEAMK
jgi:hypothetical protein